MVNWLLVHSSLLELWGNLSSLICAGFSLIIGLTSGCQTQLPQVDLSGEIAHYAQQILHLGFRFIALTSAPNFSICADVSLQAFGAKRYAAMGIIAQRAALICLLFSALIILAWTQLERLLLLLGKHYIGNMALGVTTHACVGE